MLPPRGEADRRCVADGKVSASCTGTGKPKHTSVGYGRRPWRTADILAETEAGMASTFKIMLYDPVSGLNTEWRSVNYKTAVAQARAEHARGGHVTVVNERTGKVIIWLGQNLSERASAISFLK